MDYSNLLKVYLATGVATREPVVSPFYGLPPEALADLSGWGYNDYAWWPADDRRDPLGEYQSYADEVLTADFARKVVVVTATVVDWTAEQIEADMVPKRADATANINRDVEAFYKGFVGARMTSERQAFAGVAAFVASGHTGTVPPAVGAWASASGKTAQEVADTMLAKFTAQDTAIGELLGTSDASKAAVAASTVNAELDAAVTAWQTFFMGLCAAQNITPRYDY